MAFEGAGAAEDTPWEMDAGVWRGEGGLGDSLSKGRNKQSVSWEQEGGLQRVDDLSKIPRNLLRVLDIRELLWGFCWWW